MEKEKVTVTDQFRKLDNSVVLAGRIKEFKPNSIFRKQDKNGIDYISAEGLIYCDEEGIITVPFKMYQPKIWRNKGTINEYYAILDEMINTMASNPNAEVYTYMYGTMIDNPYYSKADKKMCPTAIKANMRSFKKFEDYNASMIMEGYIKSIEDETRKGEATGRKLVRLISRDSNNNTIDHTFILPEEFVDIFESEHYDEGVTAKFKIRWVATTTTKKTDVVGKGGFGENPDDGKTYTNIEQVICGANPIDRKTKGVQLDDDLIKRALAERKLRIQEIEAAGTSGGFGSMSSASTDDDCTVGKGFMRAVSSEEDGTPWDEAKEKEEDLDY